MLPHGPHEHGPHGPHAPHWPCRNVSTTPITVMGCRQCLPLSVVHLKGKHYAEKPIVAMGL